MKTRIMACASILAVAVAVSVDRDARMEMTIPAKEIQDYVTVEIEPESHQGSTVVNLFAEPQYMEETFTVEIEEDEKDTWYSSEFYELNMAIKDYADVYASIDFHGTKIDGLAIMAQANTESAYMCDPTKTLTALYPSRFVDINSADDVQALDITKVWGNTSSLNGVYTDIPYWDYNAGPYFAWSSGDGVKEQGPLQQRVTPQSLEALGPVESEYEKLANSGVLYEAADTLYGYEATRLCTGTEGLDWTLGYKTGGDRWSIKDNCIIWKTEKESVLDSLWNTYYSTCSYTPSTEELLAVLSYAHWIPEVVKGNTSLATTQFYGFAYDGAWFDLCHQLASDEALSVIRNHVKENIDENRSLYYDSYYTKEQATQIFDIALSAGSTTNVSDSEPWQIFDELVSMGLVDPSTVILYPDYGYQHAMKYAIQYIYAYEMLEVLLIEQY